MSKTKPASLPESRSHLASLSWTMTGVLNGLRMTIPHGLSPGAETISLLNKIRDQMEADAPNGLGIVGVSMDNIPRPTIQSKSIDVLIIAEALNGIVQCLLEPDERLEQQRNLGFRPPTA